MCVNFNHPGLLSAVQFHCFGTSIRPPIISSLYLHISVSSLPPFLIPSLFLLPFSSLPPSSSPLSSSFKEGREGRDGDMKVERGNDRRAPFLLPVSFPQLTHSSIPPSLLFLLPRAPSLASSLTPSLYSGTSIMRTLRFSYKCPDYRGFCFKEVVKYCMVKNSFSNIIIQTVTC